MNLKAISICIAAVLVLTGLLAIVQAKYERAVEERSQAIKYSLAKDDSLAYMKTKLGKESARSTVLDLTLRNLQRLQSQERLAWVKQIEGVNKRMNNVEQITSTTARAVATFKIGLKDTTVVIQTDTTEIPKSFHALAFDNKDKWIRIRGYVMPDTLVAMPEVYVPLQSVVYWQRRKFLGLKIGKKDWFKQTTSPNPYVRITSDELIRVSKNIPK